MKLTQKAKIMRLLDGGAWCHFGHLNNVCFRYGARIADLRKDGHVIEKKREGDVWYYRLKEEAWTN